MMLKKIFKHPVFHVQCSMYSCPSQTLVSSSLLRNSLFHLSQLPRSLSCPSTTGVSVSWSVQFHLLPAEAFCMSIVLPRLCRCIRYTVSHCALACHSLHQEKKRGAPRKEARPKQDATLMMLKKKKMVSHSVSQ